VAIFDFMKGQELIDKNLYETKYAQCEELSKMTYAMIRNLEVK
jgi:hypothetical protein